MGNIDNFGTTNNSRKVADEIFGISEVPSDGETIDLNRAPEKGFSSIKNDNPY